MDETVDPAFADFVNVHRPQLDGSHVPPLFWASLFLKLRNEVFDAGYSFSIMQVEGEDDAHSWKVVVTEEDGIKADDPMHIYLVDHAWTYREDVARQQLESTPALLDRMTALMEVENGEKTTEEIAEEVMNESWKFCQTYKLANLELGSKDSLPIWYIMDEFGSRIQHSDEPSFMCAPFYYREQQMAYSIIWPVKNLSKGDEVTRDYVLSETDPKLRSVKLLPWFQTDLSMTSFEQEVPGVEFFGAFRNQDSLPDIDLKQPFPVKDRPLKVYTEETLVYEFLTDPKFEIVDTVEEADIVWVQRVINNFRELIEMNPNILINQFPCEMVLNCKDLLPVVARRVAPPNGPEWLAVTYNLKTELDKFVAYYQHREKEGLNNIWICKTWNLARSIDMQVTDNLTAIIRLADAGPKVACKYIHDGVLFDRPGFGLVKFDLRYNVLLVSLKPLKLFIQKVFWTRVANKPFSLDKFDNYEKHFTVMNYGDTELGQIHHDDFEEMLTKQYPDHSWPEVQDRILSAFCQLFTAAGSMDPPQGMMNLPHCRGFYGIDVMLEWRTNEKGEKYMQPIILEVNLAGDNKRCLTYHPNFYNDTFKLLFCGDTELETFQQIS